MSNYFNKIVDIENVEYSYGRCMLGKSKYKRDAIIFDLNKTYNIQNLIQNLKNKSYRPSEYREFTIYEPKKRLINAPVFRDKLAQRMIYNVIKDVYSKVFISDSYACIVDKGTHAASKKAHHYLRKAKWEYGEKTFIVKLDIKKYFYSINRDVIKGLYRKKIKCKDTLWLLDVVVNSAPGEIGLPLGNITSHTFANIVLNELDQYCKRFLGLKYYVRYMDDICIVVKDKAEAQRVFKLCKEFIENKLKLNINAKKSKIFPLAQGVNFVGFKTWCTHKLLRNSSKTRIKKRAKQIPKLIREGTITKEKAEQMLNSWFGHAKHGKHYNFIKALMEKYSYILIVNKKMEIRSWT